MQSPNIDNLFLAGGVVFYFDNGTGERDLGLIEDPPEVEPKATEIKVYSNRSGKRRLTKIFTTEEECIWSFKLQELVSANMQAFFKGDMIVPYQAGTAIISGQQLTLVGEVPVSLPGYYGISGVVVKSLDGLITYNRDSDYIVDPGQVTGGLMVGRIGRLASGSIPDGATVQAAFTYTTWASLRFGVCNDEYQSGAARIQFRPLKGFQWNYVIPRCQLKPDGKMTIDDKKVMQVPMQLEVLDATIIGASYPFGYWECINET